MLKKIFIYLLNIIPIVKCFTNGTLLPSYLCGVQGDGYPKSVGTLIPFLQLGDINTTYNQFPPGRGNIPIQIDNGENNINNALAPNAKSIIGAFHNGNPDTNYIIAIKNGITIVPTDFTNFTTGIVNYDFVIYPDTYYNMSIVVNCPTFNPPNTALDGAFVYALDETNGHRVGTFTFTGNNMSPWYACSLNNKYYLNTGIVHNKLISETGIYSDLVWKSPSNIYGKKISFIGAGVTDQGYGPFKVTYSAY